MQLATAFYGEGGGSEYAFLRRLIQRVLENMLPYVEILEPTPIYVDGDTQADKLLVAAQQAKGYGLLLFHLDSDSTNWQRALHQRFTPGMEQVRNVETAIQEIVPVVPVRMTEAWMLVDFAAFQQVTATRATSTESGFPSQPHQVEAEQDPKRVLGHALTKRTLQRRRSIPVQNIYIPLADTIDLDLLGRVPAYQRFREDLAAILRDTPALSYLGFQD